MWGNEENPPKPYRAQGTQQLGAALRTLMGCKTHAVAAHTEQAGSLMSHSASVRRTDGM